MNKKEEINVGDKIEFTEDDWNTSYRGKVISKYISSAGTTFYVYGSKYGNASVDINSIKLIK